MTARNCERANVRACETAGSMKSSSLQVFKLAVLVLGGACAQASAPPGGTPDQEAPRVIATTPDTNAVVPSFTGPVRIRFHETLSERGVREDDMVSVSPETGEVKAERHGEEVRVTIEGGWQSGRVYHVTVLPGLQDRRGNSRGQSYELVFSTGPEILPTALGGIVKDQLTDRPVANARVQAMSADSVIYTALTDTAGFFALRSLPIGAYQTVAYVDVNRNRKLDGLEPRDARVAAVVTARDTTVLEFSVLALDTTPARLLRAEARDTAHVRLSFDDFIAALEPLGTISGQVWQLPDSVPGPSGVMMRPRDYEARERAVRDTLVPLPVTRGAARDTVKALPTQELVWVPAQPLKPNTRYRIIVTGVRNIAGVKLGGGSAPFTTPARPRPPARDTTAAPVRPDSTARPDSIIRPVR